MRELELLADLSRTLGTGDYVKGGGGNTSWKSERVLWIKPSGLALPRMTADSFAALDRARLARLYEVEPPREPAARESLVKDMMAAAVMGDEGKRASVESPLHDSFTAAYVAHTHPPLVTGMLCGRDGEQMCRELFPDALWMQYTDPGYTLCMATRRRLSEYRAANGRHPRTVFMKNHGVFVAGDTAADVTGEYGRIMRTLRSVYEARGTSVEPDAAGKRPPRTAIDALGELVARTMGGEGACIKAAPPERVADGPLTPDHIVYAKSYPHIGPVSPESLQAFRARRGYWPRVLATDDGLFGVGSSERVAALALELAQDGALVARLADAFGGAVFLDEPARLFIENWEVESYRQKVAS